MRGGASLAKTPVGASDSRAIRLRRASERAAWLAPFTAASNCSRLCVPGAAPGTRAIHARAWSALGPLAPGLKNEARSLVADARSGSRALPDPPSRRSPSSPTSESRSTHLAISFADKTPTTAGLRAIRRICSVGIFVVGAQQELPRCIAASVGERIKLGLANFTTERRHAAQHFAQRSAIILRDPAS